MRLNVKDQRSVAERNLMRVVCRLTTTRNIVCVFSVTYFFFVMGVCFVYGPRKISEVYLQITPQTSNVLLRAAFVQESSSTSQHQPAPASTISAGYPKSSEDQNQALMVMAIYPDSPFKYDVIWSQLECFAGAFDRVVISAPIEFRENVTRFVQEVNYEMPEFDSRLDAEFYVNDKYDAGLWCDALIKGNALKKVAAKKGQADTYVGGHSQYNRFLLINDSMMAVKKSNEFLEALSEKNASLISLSYWGDKHRNHDQNDYNKKYWLESPLRAFSLEGIQIYADKICGMPKIKWKRDCPHFNSGATSLQQRRISGLGQKKSIKRCIVEKTEIDVVNHYALDKVYGLFPGNDTQGQTWSNNFTFWTHLRDHMSFPVVKVNSGPLIKAVIKKKPEEIGICTGSRKRHN